MGTSFQVESATEYKLYIKLSNVQLLLHSTKAMSIALCKGKIINICFSGFKSAVLWSLIQEMSHEAIFLPL